MPSYIVVYKSEGKTYEKSVVARNKEEAANKVLMSTWSCKEIKSVWQDN
jgi:hypothetical protein